MGRRTNKFKSWFLYKGYNPILSMIVERTEENIIIEKINTQKDENKYKKALIESYFKGYKNLEGMDYFLTR